MEGLDINTCWSSRHHDCVRTGLAHWNRWLHKGMRNVLFASSLMSGTGDYDRQGGASRLQLVVWCCILGNCFWVVDARSDFLWMSQGPRRRPKTHNKQLASKSVVNFFSKFALELASQPVLKLSVFVKSCRFVFIHVNTF